MRTLLLLSTVLILSGCSLFKQQTQYIDRPVPSEYTLLPATQPEAIETKAVTFNVISRQKFTEALMKKYHLDLDTAAAIAKEVFEDDLALFTVNSKNYGNLGENMQEILRFIREQREVVQYYRESVPEPTSADAKDEG